MEEKKYFIGIPLVGTLSEEVESLRKEIEQKFGLPQVARIPAHCTIIGPFMADDEKIRLIETSIRGLAKSQDVLCVNVTGFGAFAPHTHFLDLESFQGLKALKHVLRDVVSGAGCTLPKDFGDHFHVSVAVDVPTPELHAQIGAFLAQRKPAYEWFFIRNLTLYVRGEKSWEPRSSAWLNPFPDDPGM